MNYLLLFAGVGMATIALRRIVKRKQPAYKFFAQQSAQHHYIQDKDKQRGNLWRTKS